MLGLCLTAMFTLAAVAASTASAKLPEWGGCEAKAEGKYEDPVCTVKAHPKKTNGHYEWYAGASFPWRDQRVQIQTGGNESHHV